jgi:hypothetical protein
MSGHTVQIPELDGKGLREFALVTGAIVAGLFGLLLPWLFDAGLPIWPWIFFGVLALWGLIMPTWLRPVYHGWMRFGLFMSRITTPLILGIVFYVIITPIGLIRRTFGNDPLRRDLDDADSYRVPSKRASTNHLKRPF